MLNRNTNRFLRWRALVVLSILVSLCIPYTGKAQLKFTNHRKREGIEVRFIKNLLIVPIYINEKGPFNFVLDTGIGLMLITDPKLIDSIYIENLRNIKISGFGDGDDLEAYVTPSLNVRIKSDIAGTMPAAILKEDAFNLSGYTGMPIHGLMGFEFFNSFIVRVSYTEEKITIYRPDSEYKLKKASKVPLSIEGNKPYLLADINLDGQKKISAKLIVDTGAGHSLSLETDNRGIPFDIPKNNISANLGVGLMGSIDGYLARLKSIRIGKFEMKEIITAYPDYNDVGFKVSTISRNGNIGNGVFKRFELVFDYIHSALYLKPNNKYKEPFEHDMSGIELVTSGAQFSRYKISFIEKNSSAESVGLKEGDELLAINFKEISQMNIDEIEGMFRSKDGHTFLLEVFPKGGKNTNWVLLTLKKRI